MTLEQFRAFGWLRTDYVTQPEIVLRPINKRDSALVFAASEVGGVENTPVDPEVQAVTRCAGNGVEMKVARLERLRIGTDMRHCTAPMRPARSCAWSVLR